MIDDFDTEEDYADAARMIARQAARTLKKAEKKTAKKAAKRAKKDDNILFEMDEELAYGWEMRDA